MCGIAGALDLTGQRLFPKDRLLAMTRAIAHRGPEDEHLHVEPGLALGVRRLSIVDIDGGRQPMSNEDGAVWVAFNGELFAYPELRHELIGRGHHLATRCDTEVWVHLYEDFGEGIFARTRGQFAVSVWDRFTRTLLLGRDRVGICPLYYVERGGWLLWGSEIKALLASGLVEADPDPMGIDHLFSFFCAGTTRTFFEGITSIPPGRYLKIRDGQIELKQYWDLDFPDAGDERVLQNPEPLVEEFEALSHQAVRRRLMGDVPVVSYISGGLDSTVVLGLTSREKGRPVPSFTISLHRAGTDERTQAAESARILGSPLTTVTMNQEDIASAFPELVMAPEYKLKGLTDKWLLRQVAARTLPRQIANRPKTMFRASMAATFLGPHRPAWVDQLLSPESLRRTGYFDPIAVGRERAAQVRWPRITMRRIVFDVGLTNVVSTQLWHHLYIGGGLCELPTWAP